MIFFAEILKNPQILPQILIGEHHAKISSERLSMIYQSIAKQITFKGVLKPIWGQDTGVFFNFHKKMQLLE